MRNFDYLKDFEALANLYKICNKAELTQQSAPEDSAVHCRQALEWMVRAIYQLKHIEVSERTHLFELIEGDPFKEFIGPNQEMLMKAVHYVRKVGNHATHTNQATRRESFFALLNLYNIVGAILVKLKVIESYPEFDKRLLPKRPPLHVEPEAVLPGAEQLVETVDMQQVNEEPIAPHPLPYSEAETRRYFIDQTLKEAGWEVLAKKGSVQALKAGIEIPVTGMPNGSGKGLADYVLYGANGKPLAVVEAKRTSRSAAEGLTQAQNYARCLEMQYGVRPVVYTTNGYHISVVESKLAVPRRVYSYHTAEELELIIQRRNRTAITNLNINDSITNREYQKRAVHYVCERFNKAKRRALLIMATGTGKTRVSISLVDVLQRNNWVKNVLFLADRTALVKQAAKNFAKLLPSATTTILSEDRHPDMNARIMFSTYQTMINYIDSENKDFGIGRFDLIIVDEAHRSIFGKYVSILAYFDSLLVGLTATPRNEVDRNTFDLFQTEQDGDVFCYEHGEAVRDGFLRDYVPLKRGTLLMHEGIVYSKLTDEEKRQLDAVWKYEEAKQCTQVEEETKRDIGSQELFRYIFNKDTIDKVLQDLMEHGQQINNGECLGKTIVFAYNHKHAMLIVERFNELYPQYGTDFCRVIDNYEHYAQQLLEKFEVRDKWPQLAVSVDMLDTGVDVPDILNLVFFKPVHSYIKFIQMIGRGTRLSENVFGPGKDKEFFYIFDWCNNFEFFGKNPNGVEAPVQLSLTERLFGLRADIALLLQAAPYQEDAFCKGWHDELKDLLRAQVMQLNDAQIKVRMYWEEVDRFRKPESWVCLTAVDVNTLKEVIAPLLVKEQTDEKAKLFDLLMMQIMLSRLDKGVDARRSQRKVTEIATLLQEKASIPQVLQKMPFIREVLEAHFWENPSLERLEMLRKELRELVKFLFSSSNYQTFTINIQDEVIMAGEAEHFAPQSYKQRVFDYLAANKDKEVIQKIIHLEQLSGPDIVLLERILWEDLGTKEEYEHYVASGHLLCGDRVAALIRSIVGIDREVALQRYSAFLSDTVLNADQEEYLKTIIEYVCKNGDITTNELVNDPTFSDMEWGDVFGQDMMHLKEFVDLLHGSIEVSRA